MDNGRPVYLDKLFENEDQFLDDPMEEITPLRRSRKPSFASSHISKKNRQKLKRQRINSGNMSDDEIFQKDQLSFIRNLDCSKINLKQVFNDEQKLAKNIQEALKKSMPTSLEVLDP